MSTRRPLLTLLAGLALLALLAVIVVLLLALRQPDHFEVRREALVAAPPGRVYPLIADLQAMARWNPFDTPEMSGTRQYAGPAQGPGARVAFAGGQAGDGTLSITGADPGRRIDMTLDMVRPMAAHNLIAFDLQPADDGTRVAWSMSGDVPYVAKVMRVLVDVDTMIGEAFEQGLDALGREAGRPPDPALGAVSPVAPATHAASAP